jgi:hypothetical protein
MCLRRSAVAVAVALALIAAPGTRAPAAAGDGPPLSAEAFEAHTTGRTLTYARQGEVYGVEEYLPGRRVRWAFAAGLCQYGTWYPAGEQICFAYAADPEPQCWTFWLRDGRLAARFAGDPPGSELVEVEQSATPLLCPGPEVGV